jgi:hypothetical protein
MFRTINKFVFLVLILVFAVSFFSRNSYRGVENIHPKVLKEPIQEELESKEIIGFLKDDYEYELTPVFDYEISGLVVSRFDYSILGIYETGSLFPVDLCMIWGSNVESGVYKNKGLKFKQDQRWCWYKWTGELNFNTHEGSNNHLLIIDDELREAAKNLTAGDQVRINGKLVNVLGKKINEAGSGSNEQIVWKTSISRTDEGAGGCEVIYVEDLEVLERAHPVFNFLYRASLFGIVLWFWLNVFGFVKEMLV